MVTSMRLRVSRSPRLVNTPEAQVSLEAPKLCTTGTLQLRTQDTHRTHRLQLGMELGMALPSHRTLKPFAAFIALILAFSLTWVEAASASPKARRSVVRSTRRGGKSKARIASRRGGSRARYSRG